MRIAFDTNAYSALAKTKDFASLAGQADEIALPIIVLAEIQAGIMLGTKKEINNKELTEFLATPRVQILNIDRPTATHYASVFTQLRRQGTPIPINDIWIAALCLQYGFVLATRDIHFKHLPQLQTVGLE